LAYFEIVFLETLFFCNLNRTVYASPPVGGSASAKHQSAQVPLWCFAPAQFFAPLKMLRIFPYRAQKTIVNSQNGVRTSFSSFSDITFAVLYGKKFFLDNLITHCHGTNHSRACELSSFS
jgi:hypothetical protein